MCSQPLREMTNMFFWSFILVWAYLHFLLVLLIECFACQQVCIIMSRASGKTERIVVMATIAALHLLFLLYLHFAYHTIVEGKR